MNPPSLSRWNAGVGLFFERESHDGAKYPVVQDVTEKGSADREGSIKTGEILLRVDGRSCRDMTLTDLKSAVILALGHLCPPLRLCARELIACNPRARVNEDGRAGLFLGNLSMNGAGGWVDRHGCRALAFQKEQQHATRREAITCAVGILGALRRKCRMAGEARCASRKEQAERGTFL
jgi:hypothetical protein